MGGRITDDLDRELFNCYSLMYFTDKIFNHAFTFNNYASDHNYTIPIGLEMVNFKDKIDAMPSKDSPLIFGLHTNADLTKRLLESSEMIATIIDTQPKDTGGGSGKTVDDIVKESCAEL